MFPNTLCLQKVTVFTFAVGDKATEEWSYKFDRSTSSDEDKRRAMRDGAKCVNVSFCHK